MSNEWFARPVLFVADIDRSVDFYVKQLGFTQAWRYEEERKTWVAQVDRQGCEPGGIGQVHARRVLGHRDADSAGCAGGPAQRVCPVS